jgi:hypothetical protein
MRLRLDYPGVMFIKHAKENAIIDGPFDNPIIPLLLHSLNISFFERFGDLQSKGASLSVRSPVPINRTELIKSSKGFCGSMTPQRPHFAEKICLECGAARAKPFRNGQVARFGRFGRSIFKLARLESGSGWPCSFGSF